MSKKATAIIICIIVYAIAGFFVASYIAGNAYFLVNKTLPTDIGVWTWLEYWNAYRGDHIQHKRLQLAAGVGFFVVYIVPILIAGSVIKGVRSLHGDARFATLSEIKKSGLL